jgi:hypothetical protein
MTADVGTMQPCPGGYGCPSVPAGDGPASDFAGGCGSQYGAQPVVTERVLLTGMGCMAFMFAIDRGVQLAMVHKGYVGTLRTYIGAPPTPPRPRLPRTARCAWSPS